MASAGGIGLLMVCVVAIADGPQPSPATPPAAEPAPAAQARLAPAFRGRTADGRDFDSAELEGKAAVVCVLGVLFEPCGREAVALKAVQEVFGERVRVVCLAVDRDPMQDEPLLDVMIAFSRGQALSCPLVVATAESLSAWGRLLPEGTISMYPTTFVVDRDGTVRRILRGVSAPGSLQAAVQEAVDQPDRAASCPSCSRPTDVCEACWQAERNLAPDAGCVACRAAAAQPAGEPAPADAKGPLCELHARERNACRVCGSSAPR